MVVLNKIYTKTGDDGSTGLGSGERRPKYDLRISAYGTVDEANACIGMARIGLDKVHQEIDAALAIVQNDLFDLGADLAVPPTETAEDAGRLRMTDHQVEAIEQLIDRFNADLDPLKSFVLPGGSATAAHLHLARTVSRRAERLIVELAERETVGASCIHYINRVSDFLFVAARVVNDGGKSDVLWVPGQNR
ncbi:MAG: cob(I)yrinic acid a,c-diamide adenosyltransferase [Pseudomonadota bacterium]